ncbi:hypothetical protein Tco_1481696, partial [Tanacetum coccineum]
AWAYFKDMSQAIEAQIKALHAKVRVLQRQRIDNGDKLTSQIQHEHDIFRELEHIRDAGRQDGPTDAASMALGSKMAPKKAPISDATIKALIAQGVANALVEYEANKVSGNGHDSHGSGSDS